MNEQALFALAAHFTGVDVSHHSVGLEVGGSIGERARRFFEVRSAIGVSGYPSLAEAKRAIKETLESNANVTGTPEHSVGGSELT